MRTSGLFAFGIVALSIAAHAWIVEPASVQAGPVPESPPVLENPYAHTAIGAVIDANQGHIPASGEELQSALRKLGNFVQLSVPFSAVALNSSLEHPRVLLTQQPVSQRAPSQVPVPARGSWGGFGGQIAFDPLGRISANKHNLEGRLFLAANMEMDEAFWTTRVKTIEFISWNRLQMKFDFGVIECHRDGPQLKMLDGAKCFSCHKNKGPILGAGPWSNTNHNDIVRGLSSTLFQERHAFAAQLRGELSIELDGLEIVAPSAQEVDDAVRFGAALPINRQLFRALSRSAEGRRTIVVLLKALVEPGFIDDVEKAIVLDLNNRNLTSFLNEAFTIQKNAPPHMLIDQSPSGSTGRQMGARTIWSGTAESVRHYDEERASGHHGMASHVMPSNPRAFLKPPVIAPSQPRQVLSATMLARTIGLTEEDRGFMTRLLGKTIEIQERKTAPTRARLAQELFSGPEFADLVAKGEIPERDDFKDRFVASLEAYLKKEDLSRMILPHRLTYTSGPPREALKASAAVEIEVVPSTACQRCHEIQKAGKTPDFSPIPALMFDPFDQAGREAWIRASEKKKRIAVLGRMLKRLATDKDMPPEDSLEYELFRGKDPAAFNEVKSFLEAELKKARN